MRNLHGCFAAGCISALLACDCMQCLFQQNNLEDQQVPYVPNLPAVNYPFDSLQLTQTIRSCNLSFETGRHCQYRLCHGTVKRLSETTGDQQLLRK